MGIERIFKDKSYSLVGKLIFLEVMALALCSSFILSIFTPIPLALILLIHGRVQGAMMGLLGILFFTFMGTVGFFDGQIYLMTSFSLSFMLAFFVSEVIKRNIHPLKGFIKGGVVMSFLLLSILGGISLSYDGGLTGLVQKNIVTVSQKIKENQENHSAIKGIEYKEMMDLLNRPEVLARDFVRSTPLTIVLAIFFTLWVNLYLIIKAYRMFQMNLKTPYYYTELELLHYKVPEILVWPFIGTLVVMLIGEKVIGVELFFVFKNLLFVFGLFYFIQGLGVFIDLLSIFKIVGPFRSFLVILTVITSYYMLAAMGLFDMWIDFRKFFKKRISK